MQKTAVTTLFAALATVAMIFATIIARPHIAHAAELTDNIITSATLDKDALQANNNEESMNLHMQFALPNGEVHSGDTTTITLPTGFTFIGTMSFAITATDDASQTIANAAMSASTAQMVITYTDYVDTHSDITGTIDASVVPSSTGAISNGTNFDFKIDVDGTSVDAGTITVEESECESTSGGTPTLINKYGWQDIANNEIHYAIRVNAAADYLTKVKIIDSIASTNASIDSSTVKIMRGTWTENSACRVENYEHEAEIEDDDAINTTPSYTTQGGEVVGDYQLQGNVRDVTKTMSWSVAANGKTLTISPGTIGTEGLFITYAAKLDATPTDGETFSNNATLNAGGQTYTATSTIMWSSAQGSGIGYTYAITVEAKNSETHAPINDATFEVTDAQTNTEVGTVTTDSDGTATVSDLPRTTYVVTQTSAPEGYEVAQPYTVDPSSMLNSNRTAVVPMYNTMLAAVPTTDDAASNNGTDTDTADNADADSTNADANTNTGSDSDTATDTNNDAANGLDSEAAASNGSNGSDGSDAANGNETDANNGADNNADANDSAEQSADEAATAPATPAETGTDTAHEPESAPVLHEDNAAVVPNDSDTTGDENATDNNTAENDAADNTNDDAAANTPADSDAAADSTPVEHVDNATAQVPANADTVEAPARSAEASNNNAAAQNGERTADAPVKSEAEAADDAQAQTLAETGASTQTVGLAALIMLLLAVGMISTDAAVRRRKSAREHADACN